MSDERSELQKPKTPNQAPSPTSTDSLSQEVMMNQLHDIAKWMRNYEDARYTKEYRDKYGKDPDVPLDDEYKTRILSKEGLCFGLSAYLAHSVIQDEEKGTSLVDEFYEKIQDINSLKLPPPEGTEKTFYNKMQLFMLEVVQLQASEDRDRSYKTPPQNMEHILNEAAPVDASSKQESLVHTHHTYLFSDQQKLLEWAQNANAGDVLSVNTRYHTMLIYVKKDKEGQKIVGFYDPDSRENLKIPQNHLHNISQLSHFNPFQDGDKYLMCQHITSAQRSSEPHPNIEDSKLTEPLLYDALNESAFYGNNRLMMRLISEYNLDPHTSHEGRCPVHYATSDLDTLKSLIKIDPKIINTLDKNGASVLHYAAEGNNPDTLHLSLQNGLKIDAQDIDGCTPLHYAAKYNSIDAAKELIKAGVNVGITDLEGRTPLHYAAEYNSVGALKELIKAGANVGITDLEGRTLLHYTAKYNSVDTAEELIKAGVDVNARDSQGYTAEDYAKEEGFVHLEDYLRLTSVIQKATHAVQPAAPFIEKAKVGQHERHEAQAIQKTRPRSQSL